MSTESYDYLKDVSGEKRYINLMWRRQAVLVRSRLAVARGYVVQEYYQYVHAGFPVETKLEVCQGVDHQTKVAQDCTCHSCLEELLKG